jgi:hypothetical protein
MGAPRFFRLERGWAVLSSDNRGTDIVVHVADENIDVPDGSDFWLEINVGMAPLRSWRTTEWHKKQAAKNRPRKPNLHGA